MFKKIILVVLGLIVVAFSALYVLKGKDNYDATKYAAKVTNGLNIGSEIDFTLPDQFDKSHSISDDTKVLILSFAKASGHTVKEFLTDKKATFLPLRNAFFIADISPMPVIIRNTFALPDLRKSNFSVLLIYDKNIASQIKNVAKADKIAIVILKDKKIQNVKYILTKGELNIALNY